MDDRDFIYEKLENMAAAAGFSHYGPLKKEALVVRKEVRDMCAVNRCGKYGTSWVCPPGCGELSELAEKLSRVSGGIILQSTGEMEDDFDFECMMDTEKEQKSRFFALVERLREAFPGMLPMSAGTCTLCRECAYPDAPCRFPEKAFPSMEAYGLVVSDICVSSGIKYYYGPKTITYTSCILLD